MKNKSLIATLLVLTVIVIGSLLSKGVSKENRDLANRQNITIGILQFVTHEALDDIKRGIEDQLKKQMPQKQNVVIKVMNAEGDQSKIQTMSRQLVQSGSDIVIGIATPAAQGLAAASKDIPVVMSAVSDPVGSRLVMQLDQPEANVTGLSNKVPVKQTIDLMKKLTPHVKTVGILYARNEDNSLSQVKEFRRLARKKGYQVISYAVPSTNEVPATMSVMLGKVDAVFIPQDNTIASAFSSVMTTSKAAKIPVYTSVDRMVEKGGLAAISQNQYDLGVQTANQVLKLIKGKRVVDVPVKVVDIGQPLINKNVAAELGIAIKREDFPSASFIEN
ncbi:TPA: ABC transporter substrate-binding protein [Streptococcus pyogenes]|nr:ABC transporter substrate-binding protein [Streptococcus pyogenes]